MPVDQDDNYGRSYYREYYRDYNRSIGNARQKRNETSGKEVSRCLTVTFIVFNGLTILSSLLLFIIGWITYRRIYTYINYFGTGWYTGWYYEYSNYYKVSSYAYALQVDSLRAFTCLSIILAIYGIVGILINGGITFMVITYAILNLVFGIILLILGILYYGNTIGGAAIPTLAFAIISFIASVLGFVAKCTPGCSDECFDGA